jgi:hypothetical protein
MAGSGLATVAFTPETSYDGGVSVPSSSGDPLTVTLSSTETNGLSGTYSHELTVTDDGDGDRTALFRGELEVTDPIATP